MRVMLEAIDLAIEERSPYPDRASFVDADSPNIGDAIKRAGEEDRSVVVVYADGSTCVLHPEPVRV